MPNPKLFVVRDPQGGWEIRTPGSVRASSVHPTQAEAMKRAREMALLDGAEVVIQVRDGRGRDGGSSVVPPPTTDGRAR